MSGSNTVSALDLAESPISRDSPSDVGQRPYSSSLIEVVKERKMSSSSHSLVGESGRQGVDADEILPLPIGALRDLDLPASSLMRRRANSELVKPSWVASKRASADLASVNKEHRMSNLSNSGTDMTASCESFVTAAQAAAEAAGLVAGPGEENGGEADVAGEPSDAAADAINGDDNAPPARHKLRLRVVAQCVRAWLSLLPASYFSTESQYETLPDGRQRLVAATVPAIVAAVTAEDNVDANDVRDLLLTYRWYTDPHELLDRLVERFHAQPSPGADATVIPLRVVNVLRRWIKEHYYDFEADRLLVTRATAFFEDQLATSPHPTVATWAETLKRLLQEQAVGALVPNHTPAGMRRSLSFPEKYVVPLATGFFSELDIARSTSASAVEASNDTPTGADFENLNPVEIFRQLTLCEVEAFRAVTPADLYAKTVRRKGDSATSLMALIEMFNKVCYWVAREVVTGTTVKHRAVALKRFIHIAQLCFEWKNFNTCLEIVGGLSMQPVQRLRKTWKALPSKYTNMWRELTTVMSPRQNYLAYRVHVKTVQPPMLPYIGVFLSDLTVLHERHPTRTASGRLVNVAKMRLLAEVMVELQRLQASATYPFSDNPYMRRYLKYDAHPMDEEALYEASKQAEPSDNSGSPLAVSATEPPSPSSPSVSFFKMGRRTFRGNPFRTLRGLTDFEKEADK